MRKPPVTAIPPTYDRGAPLLDSTLCGTRTASALNTHSLPLEYQ